MGRPAHGVTDEADSGAPDGPAVRDRPFPVVTPLTEPFWSAAQNSRYVLQYCSACSVFTHFPADACQRCGHASHLEWREVSGAGRVYTFTVVHRAAVPGFQPPYAIAWIDLIEGPRVFGGLLDCAPGDVRIGMPVQVVFEERAGFGLMPTFSAGDAIRGTSR